VSALPQDRTLRLAPGCRLNDPSGPEELLLIPEGALRLKGPGRAIVELCDGERSSGGIIEELKRRYPDEDGTRIEAEVVAFLTRLRDRGVLEFV
jgi:pyrroloquinoline quinone biosynthesis protein D